MNLDVTTINDIVDWLQILIESGTVTESDIYYLENLIEELTDKLDEVFD